MKWGEMRADWASRKADEDPEWWVDGDLKAEVRYETRQLRLAGKLVRPAACEGCGAVGPVDGHHVSYLDPRAVRWLCRRCHWAAHGGKRGCQNRVGGA